MILSLQGCMAVGKTTVASIIAMAVWMIDRNQKPDLAAAMERPGFSL